jgi:hypothetical protein
MVQIPPDFVVKCQGIDIVHVIFGYSGDGISSTQDIETGYYGVSRSHHRRLIDLPLTPGECGISKFDIERMRDRVQTTSARVAR